MDTTKSITTRSIVCRIGRHHWAPTPAGPQMFRTCTECGHRRYGWTGVPSGHGRRGGSGGFKDFGDVGGVAGLGVFGLFGGFDGGDSGSDGGGC